MNKTVRIFDEDSHIFSFGATVINCEPAENGYKTVLDRTAFFYEGGGQPSDTGALNNARVNDVQIENGIIYHYTDLPFEKGENVKGEIDRERRFSFMQNHSGEHIVSGIVHKNYGFDNVGFHLNEELVTLDFNGILTKEQIEKTELEANRKIWQNVKFKAYYPSAEKLKDLNYRSKKELEGDIRIVEIEDTDMCACCAPHVNEAAEIGIIKLLDTEKMRGGTRIVMKCGSFALRDYNVKYANVKDISERLSAKQENTSAAVKMLEEKLNGTERENAGLKRRLADAIVNFSGKDTFAVFEEGLSVKELQLIADGLYKKYSGIRGAFSGNEENYSFAVCGEQDNLAEFFANFKAKLNVKGGGRGTLVQGTVCEKREKIKMFFQF